jgi:two-component system sensor histidine kinase VanS
MFKRKITLKLFLITTISFIVLVGIVIAVQLFVVSRLYLTTEYTKQRENDLLSECDKLNNENSVDFLYGSDDKQRVTKILNQFAVTDKAYYLILDKNFNIKYESDNASNLDRAYINSIQRTFSDSKKFPNSSYSFRINGFLNIPSRYIAVFRPTHIGKASPAYIVAVTKEVYTGQNYAVLQEYIIYLFIFAVILAAILAAVFSVIVTRPILKMRDTASQITKLDFTTRCDYRANDEIGELAESLNFLSYKLNDTIEQLKDANEKLKGDLDLQREIDRLRRDFIASVSHELKTPLTLIKGFTESIRENKVKDEEIREAQNIIVDEVDKMGKLVHDMLDLSTLESVTYKLNMQEFDCTKLLSDIADKYSMMMKNHNIIFKCKLENGVIPVYADSFRIEQVVTNFLNNAIVYTPENGTIQLRSEVEKNCITISIYNDGESIEECEIDKIWDQFYRTDKSRSKKTGGTGLGLTICKAILEKHGSYFSVMNTENGVCFSFNLVILK